MKHHLITRLPPLITVLSILVAVARAGNYDFSSLVEIDPDLSSNIPHHRVKRANIMYPNSPSNPANVTFYLWKLGEHENVTTMKIGSYIRFQLVIHFPVGTTDMLVELFTPDNDTTVMKLCNPKVTQLGSKLTSVIYGATQTLSSLNDGIILEAKTVDSHDYDRAIIEIGNVTATQATAGYPEEAMIWIEWEAVMIQNPLTVDGSTYWVSAGAEYNSANDVWVGQASFTVNTTQEAGPDPPTFNLTGPSSMEIGSSGSFRVDMYISEPSTQLVFDAFAPLNTTGVMSVCSVVLTDTAENYNCLYKDIMYTLYQAADGNGNDRGRLNIGTVTNKDARKRNIPGNRITVEFVMFLNDDPSFVGQNYWVGAAVEIGTSQIWAGQIQITATAKTTTTTMSQDPTFVTAVLGDSNVAVGDTGVVLLNMTLPVAQPAHYSLDVLVPFNNSAAQMRLCKVNLLESGANVPCLGDNIANFTSRANDPANPDRATWSLGKLTNFGHVTESTVFPRPNSMSFAIAVEVLDHSWNTAGTTLYITTAMKYTDTKLYVAYTPVTLLASSSVTTSPPTFSMYYVNGTTDVYIGGSAYVWLEIKTAPGSKYRPMDLEIIMPFENNSAVFSVCRAEILYVGANFPCFQKDKLNASFNYTSKAGDAERPDKALLTLGPLSNMGYKTEQIENTIIIAFVLKVEDHINLLEGTQRWVSAGLMYGPTTIWVGQLSLISHRGTIPALLTPPYIAAKSAGNRSNTTMAKGDVYVYDIIIKIPPISTSRYVITVATSANIKICNLEYVEHGRNLPCVRDVNATYNSNQNAVLDLGVISNLEEEVMVQDATFDNNSVHVRATVQLGWSAAVVVGSTETVSLTFTDGTNTWPGPVPYSYTVTDALVLNSTNATNPSFDFNVHSVDNNNSLGSPKLVKGEAKLFRLNIRPQNSSFNKLEVKFLTPVNTTGEMEICAVNVLHVGRNMPCNKREQYNETATFMSRYNSTYNDFGAIFLGYVCYVNMYTDPEEGKITVEAVAKLTPNTTMAVGQKFWFSATVKINDDQIYVTQIELEHIDIATFVDTSFNASLGAVLVVEPANVPILMRPGSFYTVRFAIEVPPNCTVLAKFKIVTPLTVTAVMTIHGARLTGAGINIGCLSFPKSSDEYAPVAASSMATTQNDSATINMFVITNSGVSGRINWDTPDDNKVFGEVDFQFADSIVNVDATNHVFTLTASLGGFEFTFNKTVTVNRTATEAPVLQLNITSNDTYIYDNTKFINVTALLYHETTSSAEAYNVTTTFYFPPALKFLGVVENNFTVPTISPAAINNGIKIKFDRLLFTDWAEFTIQLQVNPTVSGGPPDIAPIAETPYDTGCNMIPRTKSNFAAGQIFFTRLDSLTYQITLPATTGCPDDPLGMADGRIQDCQITGSFSPYPGQTPAKGRKDTSTYWTAAARPRLPVYMTTYFGNITRVTSIAVQHPGVNARVKNYTVQYSDDGLFWWNGESILPTPGYSTSVNYLQNPQAARYIRLFINQNDVGPQGTLSLRAEFRGCTTLSDISITDVCSQPPAPWDSVTPTVEFVSRGFLADVTTVYYCDVTALDEETMRCYSTADGLTWTALDPAVVNVVGYLPASNELYGIASDRMSFLVSTDAGATWKSISRTRYLLMTQEVGFISQKSVDWVNDAVVSDPPSAGLTSGRYAAGYRGIFRDGSVVSDWTTCCAAP